MDVMEVCNQSYALYAATASAVGMRVLYSLRLAIAKYVTRCCHRRRRPRILIPCLLFRLP